MNYSTLYFGMPFFLHPMQLFGNDSVYAYFSFCRMNILFRPPRMAVTVYCVTPTLFILFLIKPLYDKVSFLLPLKDFFVLVMR